jgi:ketosteroid isomerase-like protein
MTTDSTAAGLWHELVGAIVSGDLERARPLVTENFQWEVMGRFPYAGKYAGVEGLAALLQGVREASGNTFHMTPELTLGNDAAAAIVGRVTAVRPGKTLDAKNVFIVQCDGGRISCGWTIPMDQYAYDEFWL